MMNKTELQNRFFELSDALELSSSTGYLSIADRIYIHQERAAIMRAQDGLRHTPNLTAKPRYQVSKKINTKIKFILKNF